MRTTFLTFTATLGVATLLACGGEHPNANNASTESATTTETPAPAASAAAAGPQTPDPNRSVITVEMTTDETGSYFKPKQFDARRGDVIRFTLGQGVHNVHFLPDSNPGKAGLPAASDMLQLPGQTYDVKIGWQPGVYYFQCDPHAALGMVGHVTVTE